MRQEVALARAKNIAATRPQAHQAVHRRPLRVRWEVLGLYTVAVVLAAFGAVVSAAVGIAILGLSLLALGICCGLLLGEAISGGRD